VSALFSDFSACPFPSNEFPPFPQHREFDIYAKMIPTAAMVGGDFYDFFFVDNERLAFAVGDVAGKGIPAALSMVKALTLLKTNALKHIDPGECLRALNNEFKTVGLENVSGHDTLTLFYGVLNIKTGEVTYSCAGNPGPFVIRYKGKIEQILSVRGMPLCFFDNVDYEVGKIQLEKGDIIFAFTDSIVNTVNPEGELFDTDGLIMYLEGRNKMSLKEIIEGLLAGIKLFAEGTPQADDIAMLALRFN
jgi:sigma-B regulation protein RsbU (phosphoserine phosphatase)